MQKINPTPVIFSSFVLVGAIIVSYVLGDWIHIVITSVLLFFLVFLAIKRLLDPIFLFLFPLMASVYVVGSIFNLFKAFYFFDVIVHFVAAFVITLLAASVLQVTVYRALAKHTMLFILLTACIGITIGAWWEVFEYTAGFFITHGLVRGPGDTVLDLVIDSTGAFVAAWVSLSLFYKKAT